MKKTLLYKKHIQMGAKMVTFADYVMPISYSRIIDEHLTVRQTVGLFDLSHMGEFEISGKGAEAFLQKVTINDVSKIDVGQAQYTAMCLENGGIIDDCILYKNENSFLLVVNAVNIEKDFQWLNNHLMGDVSLKNISGETSLIAVQGPNSKKLVKRVLENGTILDSLHFYHHSFVTYQNKTILCARTGYTGELGYELYINGSLAKRLWDHFLKIGKEYQLKPIGLGARDTLRLEMKYCLYGNDIDESTNPLEAGLGWITKLDKGDFIGRNAIKRIKEKGVSRRLVAFEMLDRGIPRHNYQIFLNNQKVGIVTSGNHSPSLKKGIGMGYVDFSTARVGTEIQIVIRNKLSQARVIKPPFWKEGSLLN